MNKRKYSDFKVFFIFGECFIEFLGIIILNLKNINQLILPVSFYLFFSMLLAWLTWTWNEKCNISNKWLLSCLAIIFVGADQGVKFVVNQFYTEKITLIPMLLNIKVIKNYNEMAFLNFTGIVFNHSLVVIIKIVICILFTVLFIWKMKNSKSIYLSFGYVLSIAACFSSIIDSIMWRYTLDYINFQNVLSVDIKDFYAGIGISMFIFGLVKDETL